ncbi:MAG: metalloregulator ArsR/SmtB family transcription factor [Burkholderiaceae bacterium]
MPATLVIQALNALGHEHRLSVFRLLAQAGPIGLSAGNISSTVGISPASMSFHLKDLLRADLIHRRLEGRKIFYSARVETMNAVIGYLTENCSGVRSWTPAVSAPMPDKDPAETRPKQSTGVLA